MHIFIQLFVLFLVIDFKDNNQDTESANDETSDISSELDYLDRSVSNTNSTDEDSPSAPQLSLVNTETNELFPLPEYNLPVGNDTNTPHENTKEGNATQNALSSLCEADTFESNSLSHDHSLIQSEASSDPISKTEKSHKDASSRDRILTQSEASSSALSPKLKSLILDDVISRDRNPSQSDDSTLVADQQSVQSDESNLTSHQSNDSISDHDHYAANPDLCLNSFPQVYSTTPLNLSDLSFSDVSCDRSLTHQESDQQFQQDSIQSGEDFVNHESCVSSEEESRNDETPPLCLDVDGAEELDDMSSCQRSNTLKDFDLASLDFFRSIERTYTSQMSRDSKTSQSSANQMHLLVDSWSDVRPPSGGYVISLDVSDLHIWCVTNYESIFYYPTHYEAISWTQLEGQARMISVNNSGDVIWCVDSKNNAFARKGIREGNLIGNEWLIVEKNIRFVAVDETAVWGIMQNGDVIMRIEVSKDKPEGKTGKTIAVSTDFVQASCLDGLVWFVDSKSAIHVYKGMDCIKRGEGRVKQLTY